MIVHPDSTQTIGRVLFQKEHAALVSRIALGFGNQDFAAPEPAAEMQFLALNHDRGWDDVDAHIGRNPATGLPYHLVQTPLPELLRSGLDSVAYNKSFHPYCGLLAAMHVWGLYNGRYGLSDKIVVSLLQGADREQAAHMLARIKASEHECLSVLRQDPHFQAYVVDEKLAQNYKLLQFFDTLALYFNDSAGKDGQPTEFFNVPHDSLRVTKITLTPLGQKKYRLAPFPFAGKSLTLKQSYYEIPVLDTDVDYRHVFAECQSRTETLHLVS